MPWLASAMNPALDALVALATSVSIHTGDPGTTGANEVTGGIPAYARQTPTWGPAAAGQVAITAALTFDIPGGTSYVVTHWGLWNGATFLRGGTLGGTTSDRTFDSQGTLVIDQLKVTGA